LQEINNIFDQAKLFFKYLVELIKNILDILKSLLRSNNKFRLIFYKFLLFITIITQRYLNQKTVLHKNFGMLPIEGQKYLYFPLYNIPEYSSNFQSTMWLNINSIVEMLAKTIPGDWIIVLKEHPTGLNFNCREVDFYKKIQKLPNVVFAPLHAETEKLISNSELIFVTVGTSGWEGILKGKPVLSPVENFWDCMGLSSKCSDIEKFDTAIKSEIERNNIISDLEREKRITTFLEALQRNSFPISNPEAFSFYYDGDAEEYNTSGKELAAGLISFFKKVNIEKSIGNKEYFKYDTK